MIRRRLVMAAALVMASTIVPDSAPAQSRNGKPRVPAGMDPGGIAVAVIGGGIDYSRGEVAVRLARDGEGQLIAFDVHDNDNRPYDACADGAQLDRCSLEVVRTIAGEAPASRLVIVRASTKASDLIEAVKFVVRTPARIALLALASPIEQRSLFLASAADHFPDVLFIGPVAGDTTSAGLGAARPNLIVVAGDHAVIAASRIAATAARLRQAQPGLGPAELKGRIEAMSRAVPAGEGR